MKAVQWLLQQLFPEKCILCGRLLKKDELDLCRDCRVNAPECPVSGNRRNFLDSWLAVWYYEGNVRRSLVQYKFYGRRSHVHGYGRILSMKLLREHPEGFDALIWVPISKIRKFFRGYDQVELLASAVGRELGLEPVPLLKKIRHNRPQSGIVGQAQRRANVLGVYRVTDPEQIRGKRILLLDDIITTGATADEAARVLLTAGGEEVHFGAVAAARHSTRNR